MTVTPVDVLDAVVATIAPLYPSYKTEAHGGQFNESEIALLLGKAPCILVSCLRVGPLQASGMSNRWRGTTNWAIYVIARDGVGVERDESALSVAYALSALIPTQHWGVGESKIPELNTVIADNLFSGHINNLRVAIWGVSWQQIFTFTID